MISRRALFGVGVAAIAGARPAVPDEDRPFVAYVAALRARADAAGLRPDTLDRAFRDLGPDPKVAAFARRQSEFSRPIGDYVAGAASPDRVAKGRALATRHAALLDRIELRFGVPRTVVLAIWGLESGFGASGGTFPVLRSLATLAFGSDRRPVFEAEFLDALRILEGERMSPSALLGSWAGAMGQVQFLPSAFLRFAADGDGDGHRDIWRSDADALASIANFLAGNGWRRGALAAIAVELPSGLDIARHRRPFAEWGSERVTGPDGRALPSTGEGVLFLPAGIAGPAFLLGDNWEVLRAYNLSDSYALGVATLADRIGGAPARPWPVGEPMLDAAERRDVQIRLAALGFYEGVPDGRFGARTRDAVRAFQVRVGLVPDGYPGRAVLERLRAGR